MINKISEVSKGEKMLELISRLRIKRRRIIEFTNGLLGVVYIFSATPAFIDRKTKDYQNLFSMHSTSSNIVSKWYQDENRSIMEKIDL